MIKSISYWAFENGMAGTHSIEDALAEAKEAGFEGLELAIGTEGVLHTAMTENECREIRKKIDESGLIVQTTATGISWGLSPTSNDPETRRESIELHKAALQITAWLGCEAMLMVPGVVKSPISTDIIPYDMAVERCCEAVKELLIIAEKVNVDICLENVWNGLFYSPIEFANFIDSFASDRCGIYLDVGNLLGYQQHPPHWITYLGSRIKRVHIKDFTDNFNWTGAYSFCDIGAGQVPWQETIQALKKIGYNKTIVAEMMPWDQSLIARTSVAVDKILSDEPDQE